MSSKHLAVPVLSLFVNVHALCIIRQHILTQNGWKTMFLLLARQNCDFAVKLWLRCSECLSIPTFMNTAPIRSFNAVKSLEQTQDNIHWMTTTAIMFKSSFTLIPIFVMTKMKRIKPCLTVIHTFCTRWLNSASLSCTWDNRTSSYRTAVTIVNVHVLITDSGHLSTVQTNKKSMFIKA